MNDVEAGGARIPKLGLGTWQLEGQACRETVAEALSLGYRHLDTAQGYENEEQVGQGLADSGVPRERVWVTTKLWVDDRSREEVVQTARESRTRLGLDAIDLLLIHWPPQRVPLEPSLEALREVQEQGIARHVGVSNFPAPLLERALELAPLVCDQVEYHPFLAQRELLELTKRRGLALAAYSPLARGKVNDDPTLRAIGDKHGKTPAQVALRWLIQQDQVVAIPKASSVEHLQENLAVLEFLLSTNEMQEIDGLARGERLIDPEFAPEW